MKYGISNARKAKLFSRIWYIQIYDCQPEENNAHLFEILRSWYEHDKYPAIHPTNRKINPGKALYLLTLSWNHSCLCCKLQPENAYQRKNILKISEDFANAPVVEDSPAAGGRSVKWKVWMNIVFHFPVQISSYLIYIEYSNLYLVLPPG